MPQGSKGNIELGKALAAALIGLDPNDRTLTSFLKRRALFDAVHKNAEEVALAYGDAVETQILKSRFKQFCPE